MIDGIDHMVDSAVSSVFATMLNFPVVKEPAGSPLINGEAHVAGSVGFIGALTGVVFVYSTAGFARKATLKMLGLPNNEVSSDEVINDAMGEITNMVVGQIKSRLTDRGLKCSLTIPSILRGSHFTIEPTSSIQRRVSSFRCDGSQVVVEVLIKPAPKEPALAVLAA